MYVRRLAFINRLAAQVFLTEFLLSRPANYLASPLRLDRTLVASRSHAAGGPGTVPSAAVARGRLGDLLLYFIHRHRTHEVFVLVMTAQGVAIYPAGIGLSPSRLPSSVPEHGERAHTE